MTEAEHGRYVMSLMNYYDGLPTDHLPEGLKEERIEREAIQAESIRAIKEHRIFRKRDT